MLRVNSAHSTHRAKFAQKTDVVSLHVPLNATNRHLIGESELALTQREGLLINTCRGPVVDDAALTRTLADGALFGAGLDVFDQEPTPLGNPPVKLDNEVRSARAKSGLSQQRTSKISRACSFLQGPLQLNRQNRLSNKSNRLA